MRALLAEVERLREEAQFLHANINGLVAEIERLRGISVTCPSCTWTFKPGKTWGSGLVPVDATGWPA